MDFTIYHSDHGITDGQLDYVERQISRAGHAGFFVQRIDIPGYLGKVPCGLYGPAMGDDPLDETLVAYVRRSEDRPADRMIRANTRPVSYVQAIGVVDGDTCQLFTCYGGPLAPQNPEDPTLSPEKKGEAEKFWAEHALAY